MMDWLIDRDWAQITAGMGLYFGTLAWRRELKLRARVEKLEGNLGYRSTLEPARGVKDR